MKNYQSINLVKTLTNKECLHKTYIPWSEYSKTIVINDNCLISERVYECKECGSIFSLYEISNDHLKSFKDEFLSNIPPLFKESREQKADRFFKNESYQKAFLEYKELLNDYYRQSKTFQNEKISDKIIWIIRLSEIESKLRNIEEAIKFLNKEIKIDPSNEYFICCRGKFKAQKKDFKGAIKDFTHSIKLNNEYSYAFVLRADSKKILGEYKGAKRDYTKAIKLYKRGNCRDLSDLYKDIGEIKCLLEDHKGAIKDFTKAIETIYPYYVTDIYHESQLFLKRGQSKYDLKDYLGAIDDCSESMEIFHCDDALLLRGQAKFKLGQHALALEDFEEAIKENPKDGNLIKNLAFAKAKLGDSEGAIKDLTKAIKLNNHDGNLEELYAVRSRVKYESKDYKGALKDCKKAIEVNPEFDYSYEILKMIKVKLSELNSSKNN